MRLDFKVIILIFIFCTSWLLQGAALDVDMVDSSNALEDDELFDMVLRCELQSVFGVEHKAAAKKVFNSFSRGPDGFERDSGKSLCHVVLHILKHDPPLKSLGIDRHTVADLLSMTFFSLYPELPFGDVKKRSEISGSFLAEELKKVRGLNHRLASEKIFELTCRHSGEFNRDAAKTLCNVAFKTFYSILSKESADVDRRTVTDLIAMTIFALYPELPFCA